MEENDFWLRIFKISVIGVCVIVIALIGSCQSSKYQIRKSIEAGYSPMSVACAFDHGNVSDGTLCAIELVKTK